MRITNGRLSLHNNWLSVKNMWFSTVCIREKFCDHMKIESNDLKCIFKIFKTEMHIVYRSLHFTVWILQIFPIDVLLVCLYMNTYISKLFNKYKVHSSFVILSRAIDCIVKKLVEYGNTLMVISQTRNLVHNYHLLSINAIFI